MAQNWWEDDPVAEGNNSNWWSSDPLADAPAEDPAQQELPAGVAPSVAGGGRGFVNPPLASEPQPQRKEPPGFFGRLADSVGTGVEQAKTAISSINVTAQNEALRAKREQLARMEASGMGESPEAAGLRTHIDAVSKRQGEYIADLAEKQKVLAASPVYQGVRDLGQAKTFGEAWRIFAKDPVNIALNLGAQSLPAMAPGIITSAINPAAGMAVMGASSAGVEFGSSIMEFAQKNGVDTSSRDALASFYSNPEMLDAAKSYAATRAGIIGLADTASMGIASKTLVPKMITGPVARVATNTAAQMGVQGISGGVGEAGAQIATEGRITSPGEVVAEMAGEFAGAPLEVAGMRANVRKEREQQAVKPTADVTNFTPPDSVTAQAGLAPVVVPLPRGGIVQGEMDVSVNGPDQPAVAGRTEPRSDLAGAGVDTAGVSGLGAIGDVRPGADGVAPVDGQTGAVANAGVQRPAPVAGDPLKRATDTSLLSRAEAAQPAPTEQPAAIWTGRKGDGYDTRGDAEIALPTRIKREPDLRWEVEQMPSGKFRLAGYEQQPAAQPQPTPQPQALTAQQFMQNPAQAIETAQQITFGPGQMGAVKVSDRKALNSAFNVQEMDDGTTVFTRAAAAPAGAPAVAGSVGQRAAQPSAEQQAAVLSDLNKASAGRFAAVAANTSFTGVAQRIAAAFGRPVMLIRDRNGNAGFNALFYPRQGVIAANVDSDRPMYAVVTHEVYHGLPDDLRQRTTDAVMATVTPEQRARFLSEFATYQKVGAKLQDEELVARIIEQDAENPQFWQKLADRMGDSEFAKLAREILGMLDRLLAGFTREDSSEFTSDIERVREVVAEAYAEAQARMGQASDAEAMASTPRKRETIGEYQAIPYKDGSTTILGDVDEIRSKLPDDVKGRVVDGGIRFTTSDSQRVRAALEGRQVAYSRAGAVLDKLPMKDGKYLGAPPDYDTPAKIPTLRKMLRSLTKEGEAGRFWYENSSKAVLRMTGGNVQEARKFVALLAIYSPQAKVDTNTTFAIRAWSQYKAGQPISVKTKVMDQKAAKAMQDIDAFWSGEKTGNFFFNLLREIDPTTEGKQGATIDMWMMRAGMYPTDAPTKTQYAFMENETNRIADEMGWEPQQVQAAIWVAMKARMENAGVKKRTEASSEKKGWIRFDRDAKGKKVRVILDAQKHRDNWLAHAMRHIPSATDTRTAKFDFEDGLLRHIGQISFEARPGRTSGSLPGIHSAPYAQQVEFQQAVQKTFYDERGTDMLASYLGLMIDNDILAPGVWQGEVSPSTQMSTVMAPVGGKDGKNKVDPAQAKLLNVYASVLGLLTRQEGVGWHRPFYATTKRDANGLDIDIGRPVNPQEAADLERAVGVWMDRNGKPEWQNSFAFISSPKGIRLVNFGIITNEILQTEIVKAAESVLPDGSVRVFASDGDMPTNNWKENPNGETYVQGIRAEGRSDVLDWARANLAPRIDAVFRDFAERYNWGDAGDVRFSARRDGAGRQGAGRTAPGSLAAPERAAQEATLTPLPGAPKVPGFHGPDPRLVAVAEKYAADNGIELRRQAEYVQVDPERAARIAEAYEAMPHAPQDPQVREAYENLIRQTRAQYDALVDAGYQFWFMDMSQPASREYASTPWNAMRDIRANQQMGVFPTEDGFGTNEDFTPESNPLLADTGLEWPSGSLTGPRKRVLANDLFRAVHDAFGHGLEGSGFRAQGEENAWQAHVRLFTGSAVGAITSETRGQNSWLNYGPYGEANRTAQVEDTVFADQKTGLMPEWTWTEGRVGDMPMASANRTVTDTPEFKRWFGDSKVVDADGKPLVVYHGTDSDFSAFDLGMVGSNNDTGMWGVGFYFSPIKKFSQGYGSNLMKVYVALQNPLVVKRVSALPDEFRPASKTHGEVGMAASSELRGRLIAAGYDGVMQYEPTDKGDKLTQVVAFRPEQIKSAIGNNGQFDPENPDIRMSAQRGALGLFSALERNINSVPTKSASAGGWKTQIQGMINKGTIKADEVEWSGINDWLDLQPGKVSKDQVLEYLRGNGVKVEEVTLSDGDKWAVRVAGSNETRYFDSEREANRFVESDASDAVRAMDIRNDDDEEIALAEERERYVVYEPGEWNDVAKYGKYTLPGGENYREVLLTLPVGRDAINDQLVKAYEAYLDAVEVYGPNSEQAKAAKAEEVRLESKRDDQTFYKSSHWDQPNILAHIRVNDRTDTDGKRVLFVEEIQSDWGQEGKKKGFASKPASPELQRLIAERDRLIRESDAAADSAEGLRIRMGVPALNARITAMGGVVTGSGGASSGIPAAPFVTKTDGWLNLALKRVIAMAVDGGYDKVAFVNGEQSATRYDLSKQVSKVSWTTDAGTPADGTGRLRVWGMNGSSIFDQYIEASNLEDHIGKELAAKLVESPVARQSGGGRDVREVAGDGLKIGGEGMKAFYDKIVPNAVKALLKKVGGDGLTEVNIESVSDAYRKQVNDAYARGSREDIERAKALRPIVSQLGFTITDTMREKVAGGLPMFSANRSAPIKGSRFTLPGMDGNRLRWDKIRRALQDDALRMKRVQDAVRDAGGVVNEEQNFYDANTLMPGRVQTMMDDFRKDVILPMIEKAAKAKIDLEELALYAYAKHAEERNDYIASINPRMPDGGSGMTTADANKILADIAASGKQADYDSLHQDLMSITETTRRVLLDEGLIDQDQFDAMEQQYGNYIPLRGFENVDEETGAIRPGIGRGVNVRGKETIKALGRKSRAGDLIENVIRDYQRAVVRSEKNNVGKVLLDFVLSNPDPDLWGVDVDKTTASFDKKRGIVQYTKTIDKGEDTIGVKVAGKQVYIKLVDKDLTRALKQSFKDEVSGLERATVAMSGWYNNLLRNVLTRYNPPFAMVNAIRDAQSGLVAAMDELGAKGAAAFSAHLPKAIAATTADETQKMWLSNPLTQQYLREFKASGAVTGGFYMRNLEDIAKELRDDLLMAGAAPRTLSEKAKFNPGTKFAYKGARWLLRGLELLGSASENATRFALYMAARDMGRTPAQAALLAKNGTTNFNRKGEWGGALNNLYLFFTAAIQGNAQLIKTLRNPKVAAALTGVAGLTVALAFMNASMGGEDDDGEKYWDKVPNYEKERNLIIMLTPGDGIGDGVSRVGKRGRYIKIPVQYGLNFFPNLGYSISDIIRNKQDPRQGKTVAKASMHMVSTFFGSMNPFGGAVDLTDSVSIAMAAAPTIIDPAIQIMSGRNAFGTPTVPDKFPGDTRPDSERMFISQMDGFAADLAKMLNEMGGGNQSKAGSILGVETAVAPGTIKTVIAATTGGLGTFFEQIYDTTAGAISDDKNVKTNRIPLLNKVYGEAGEDVNVRLAGDRMREVGAAVKVIENQIKDGIKPEITDDDKRLMSIASAQEIYNKESAKLRKDEIDVIRSTTMTPEQKRLARDNIMAARDRLATGVNRAYLNSFGINEKAGDK